MLIFILLIKISNGIIINEIMADPIADESLNEWIELFNNGSTSINVSNWIIGDDKDNDTLEGGLFNKEGTIIEPLGFAIITDDTTRAYNNFNISNNAIRLYVDDGAIGNGLINSGETIYLYDNNGNLIDIKTYNSTTEDLSWAFVNGSLHKSNPTPGFLNEGSIIPEQGCDYAVEYILAKTVFDNSSEFTFKMRASKLTGSSTNFTMRSKIEDLNGKLIKEHKPFTNQSITRQRTSSEFTPNLEEGKSYFMEGNITVQCNDSNLENNFDTRIISIKGKPLQEESSIKIENILDLGSDKRAKFGQTIRIRLSVYKGNTNKKNIVVYVEDNNGDRLSKQSKTNLVNKFTNYSLTLPVQIKPNCKGEFDDDDYNVIAKGLDAEDDIEVKIEDLTNDLCEVKLVDNKKSSISKFDFELTSFNEVIKTNEEFNTKIMFDNNNDRDIDIKVWSYVYRGSKSYSGEREDNMEEFVLKANSLQIVELYNIVGSAESGNYKFKVLINKNDQKTNNDITRDIIINNNLIEDNKELLEKNEIIFDADKITGNVVNYGIVYESSTEKAKNLILVFLVILSILLNVILIWRR